MGSQDTRSRIYLLCVRARAFVHPCAFELHTTGQCNLFEWCTRMIYVLVCEMLSTAWVLEQISHHFCPLCSSAKRTQSRAAQRMCICVWMCPTSITAHLALTKLFERRWDVTLFYGYFYDRKATDEIWKLWDLPFLFSICCCFVCLFGSLSAPSIRWCVLALIIHTQTT